MSIIDIRCVDLIKISDGLSLEQELDSNSTDQNNYYLCLGHFDLIHIREIDNKIEQGHTVFSNIYDDYREIELRNDFERFVYPLYVIHENGLENVQSFWDANYPCIIVARIHCENIDENEDKDTKKDKKVKLFNEILIEYIKENCNNSNEDSVVEDKKQFGDLSVMLNNEIVHCLFCQTLELGDVTVIIKGESINACLEISRILFHHKNVEDVYSYCGFHHNLINGKYEEFFNKENIENTMQTKIHNVGIRFSVKSSKLANLFWKELGVESQVHYVTGTADALIEYDDDKITTRNLLEIIKRLDSNYILDEENKSLILLDEDEKNKSLITKELIGEPDKANSIKISRFDAFNDIITRVGMAVDFGLADNSKTPKQVKNMKKHDLVGQELIKNQLNNIQKNINKTLEYTQNQENNPDWLVALFSQVKILLTMMNNCVLDDLSLLMWPSVRAFISRLDSIIKKHSQTILNQEELKDLNDFMIGWSMLTDDIVHLESQLVQNPKLQSPRVYIPTSLLVYYMSLLLKFNTLLEEIDKVNNVKYHIRYFPLITYSIDSRANTLCIHDPVKSNYTEDAECALLVSIPVSTMYYPSEVSAILCHEYAHYVGEFGRLRDERFNYIIKTAAWLLTNLWFMDIAEKKDNNTIIPSIGDEVYDYLQQIIRSGIAERMKELNIQQKSIVYIDTIKKTLPLVLITIYLSKEIHSKVLMDYCNIKYLKEHFVDYISQFKSIEQHYGVARINERISNILLLYHECYADLVVVLCLKLSQDKYLEYIFKKEVEKNSELNLRLRMLAFQAAIVCQAIVESSIPWNNQESEISNECKDIFELWLKEVHNYINQLGDENATVIYYESCQENNILFYVAEFGPLLIYLMKCAKKLNQELLDDGLEPKKNTLKSYRRELMELFNVVDASNFSLSEFRKKIDAYHKNISNGEWYPYYKAENGYEKDTDLLLPNLE